MTEVWYVAVDSVPAGLAALLDDGDRERLDRLARQRDRARSLAAWTLARLVLARWLQRPPERLAFDRTCRHCGAGHGKPVADPAVDFSVSHTGDLAVVAVSEHTVGVDAEDTTAGRTPVTWALSEPERAQCRDYASFARVWTRKEAVLKALGRGVTVRPADVVTSGTTLLSLPPGLGDPRDFTLHDLLFPTPYVGTVAVRGNPGQVTVRHGSTLIDAHRLR
ncbi:4'-phosphopantetheinyl transferase family protein [Streptomyces sp. NPDC091377]|uniref:4'-phosphopantetheinyl transferase family protein n=1 Tax=Streptomyces sp. NPDC091377 TaxID=3365995 RepID=UPI0037FD0D2C